MAWYPARTTGWQAKAVIAAGLLAVLLVAVVPVALFVGVILMVLGHVVAGLAVFGGSVLAAVAAVVIASLSGVRQLRKLTRELDDRPSPRDGERGQREDRPGQRDEQVVRLSRDEYSYE